MIRVAGQRKVQSVREGCIKVFGGCFDIERLAPFEANCEERSRILFGLPP